MQSTRTLALQGGEHVSKTEVFHSLIPGNNTSHTRDLLTKTETHRILGGWHRHIKPWGNLKKRVEKVTQGNPSLRRKVLWSVMHHSLCYERYGIISIVPLVLSCLFLTIIPTSIIASIIAIVALLSLVSQVIIHDDVIEEIKVVLEPPIFPKLDCSTGFPELDAIFTESSFEIERILIDGGMQLDELNRLSVFARTMVAEKRLERPIVEELVTDSNTMKVSPEAWELVKRATVIMSGASLPHVSPVTDMLDVLEYARIPVRKG